MKDAADLLRLARSLKGGMGVVLLKAWNPLTANKLPFYDLIDDVYGGVCNGRTTLIRCEKLSIQDGPCDATVGKGYFRDRKSVV